MVRSIVVEAVRNSLIKQGVPVEDARKRAEKECDAVVKKANKLVAKRRGK